VARSATSVATRGTDWLTAGLGLLRDGGELSLTIDRLCQALHRTKGAFYHHFGDLGAYQDRLLEHWEALNTAAPIAAAERAPRPDQRRSELTRAVARLDLRVEQAVRAWALRDARARRALVRVDQRRVQYLASLSSKRPSRRALLLARLDYATYLGAQQLLPSLSARDAKELEQALRSDRKSDGARGGSAHG